MYLYPFLDCSFVLTISIGEIAATAKTAKEKDDVISRVKLKLKTDDKKLDKKRVLCMQKCVLHRAIETKLRIAVFPFTIIIHHHQYLGNKLKQMVKV